MHRFMRVKSWELLTVLDAALGVSVLLLVLIAGIGAVIALARAASGTRERTEPSTPPGR